jgi:hypothetical protein
MKVKKYTITISDLNTLPYIEFNLEFLDKQGYTYYPKAIQYENFTNAELQFLYLSNDEERDELNNGDYSTYFEYLSIPDDLSVADLPRTKYIRVKKLSGTAIQDLTFYAYNFSTWQR